MVGTENKTHDITRQGLCNELICVQIYSRTCRQSPVSVSQILALLSLDAVSTLEPWGEKATFEISPSCPAKMAWHAPVMVLYTRALPSLRGS